MSKLLKKYVIKKQSGFSFVYFKGFEKYESDPQWTGHIHEAELFDYREDAEGTLVADDEQGYSWHEFGEGIYWVDEILIIKEID